MKKESENFIAKPVLRWAGGKTWLIKHLPGLIGNTKFNNYFEPFLGGASIFLAVNPQKKAFLLDLNKDLIKTYNTIKYHPRKVINSLYQFKNTENCYYETRETTYENRIDQAARFIYLNQTSFNGIYRVNLNGKYNVPYGHRSKNFIEPDKIVEFSRRLKNAKLSFGDFSKIAHKIKKNDLVFLDPPYTVSHNHNGFIKYNHKLFSLEDQLRLSQLIDEVKEAGAYYILTNAAHEKIKEIFGKGDNIYLIDRASLIGGLQAHRGQTTEYLFTNL